MLNKLYHFVNDMLVKYEIPFVLCLVLIFIVILVCVVNIINFLVSNYSTNRVLKNSKNDFSQVVDYDSQFDKSLKYK